MKKIFKVDEQSVGQRLDLFLATIQNNISRTVVRQKINAGEVFLNGEVEFRPHYKMKLDDEVSIDLDVEVIKEESLMPEDIPLNIIWEDDDLLVVNKPSGMVIHPATGNYSGTLMNAVLHHNNEIATVGNQIRSGLIHRIDKDTSGLVMVGKTNKGLWYYSKLFAEREVKKTYIAIVAGNISVKIPKEGLVVRNYLGRCPGNRKKYSVVNPTKGKISETFFKLMHVVKVENKFYSIITAMPKTGRTHQIRVHLASLGHPILGDVIYGKHNKYQRLLLHAWKIKVKLLNGKTEELIAPIPNIFNDFIDNQIEHLQ